MCSPDYPIEFPVRGHDALHEIAQARSGGGAHHRNTIGAAVARRVFSLSHVALPFARISSHAMLRLRGNPFYPYLGAGTRRILGLLESTGGVA